ncbi:hypothetical protein PS1_005999 [Malus domestica]
MHSLLPLEILILMIALIRAVIASTKPALARPAIPSLEIGQDCRESQSEKYVSNSVSVIKHKQITNSDAQTGLIYLLIAHKETWADKTYLEKEYSLHGYWLAIVNGLDNITKIYVKVDREVAVLPTSSKFNQAVLNPEH